jgi:hypothetical protein
VHVGETKVPEVSEMAFKTWAESTWTKGLARAAMLFSAVLLSGFVGTWAWMTWGVLGPDLVAANAEIASVKSTLVVRTADSESFQTEVRKAVADINVKIEGLSDDMFTTKVNVGVIKQLVTELRNQQITDAKARLGPAVFGDTVILAVAPRGPLPPDPFPALAR